MKNQLLGMLLGVLTFFTAFVVVSEFSPPEDVKIEIQHQSMISQDLFAIDVLNIKPDSPGEQLIYSHTLQAQDFVEIVEQEYRSWPPNMFNQINLKNQNHNRASLKTSIQKLNVSAVLRC
jgi:hypothetical protein